MKNTFKMIGIIAIVAIIGLAVVACSGGGGGKLSGTYKLDTGNQSYRFTGNKIETLSGDKVLMEGTFTTSNGQLTMQVGENTVSFPYTLEGNKLSIGEGAAKAVYTKQ